ncbi:MAG: thioredoxin family protein [Bacteroidales bacterium]|nr:thioredoxin family protein [Bacteroidales bacterium]
MKKWFLVLLIAIGIQGFGQTVNKVILDPAINKEVMIGYCNKSGLEKGVFADYFNPGFEKYKPSKKYIDRLKPIADKIEFTVVMGTWCGDSQLQVPRFYKILSELGYSDKRVKLIGVDRSKAAILVDIKDLNIERVPTFILYKNGIEIGRIIETPTKSMEKNLWKIISTTL